MHHSYAKPDLITLFQIIFQHISYCQKIHALLHNRSIAIQSALVINLGNWRIQYHISLDFQENAVILSRFVHKRRRLTVMQEKNSTVPQPTETQQPMEAQPQTPAEQADSLKTYASRILTAVLIVAAIVIAGYRYLDSSNSGKQEAANKLFSAKNAQDLELIITKNASSPVAPLAILKLAKVHFNSGNYDGALTRYNEFKTKFPQHELVEAAEMGRLHCLEARNQVEDALKGFTEFAASKTNHFLYAEAVTGKARCMEQLGKNREAIAVYEDFIAANPKSAWTSKMEDLMASLKKKTEEKKTSG